MSSGEAVPSPLLALRRLKKKKEVKKTILVIFKNFEIFKFQFFGFTPLNFHHLIVKTASPGPEVSVPTLGSWEYGV